MPGTRVIGEARDKTGVLSFVIDGAHPHDVGTILDREGIAVRTGQHCAQPVMDRFGIAATIRASLAHLQHTRGHRRADRGAGACARGVRLMSDLTDLYQEVILDHNRRPRNFRAMDEAESHPGGLQPAVRGSLDALRQARGRSHRRRGVSGIGLRHLQSVRVADDRSAEGQDRRRGTRVVRQVSRDGDVAPDQAAADLGKLSVLAGVREYPTRIKCASLAWHTLKAAVAGEQRTGLDRVKRTRR